MSLETGIALSLAIVIFGDAGLTGFAVWLKLQDSNRNASD